MLFRSRARAARTRDEVERAWRAREIAIVRTGDWARTEGLAPDVVIDAILAKRNVATRRDEASLVIALGPGFVAGADCHIVIETNRGHNLGRLITSGSAEPNTGVPGEIAGHTDTRVLRAPAAGTFRSDRAIGDTVRARDVVGHVAGHPVIAGIDGVLRGLIRAETEVTPGLKVGVIDPRGRREYCDTISDKARAIAGAALEGVMRYWNAPGAAL